MTETDLKRHYLFRLLTPQERRFALAYVGKRDFEAAVAAAYPKAKRPWEQARRLQSRPVVAKLIAVMDGQYIPSREELIHSAWCEAQTAKSEYIRQAAREQVARLADYDTNADIEKKQRDATLRELLNKR